MPTQGFTALLVGCIAVAITMAIVFLTTRHEKNRPADDRDDH
jgi:hypothetical protein